MDLQTQVEEISSKAKFGDLIEFSCPIGYSHWGLYDEDGYVLHYGVTDETQLMKNFRTTLQSVFPMGGDMLMGVTRIRRVPMGEVNLPKGVRVLISNNRHAFKPSSPEEMRRRFDALKDVELPYNFLFMNCEHFVTFVRYGKAICNQILTKPQNRETKSATRILQDIVDSKNPP